MAGEWYPHHYWDASDYNYGVGSNYLQVISYQPKESSKRMSNKHDHQPSCKHEQVSYCKQCDVVYCKQCNVEWYGGYWSCSWQTQTTSSSLDSDSGLAGTPIPVIYDSTSSTISDCCIGEGRGLSSHKH